MSLLNAVRVPANCGSLIGSNTPSHNFDKKTISSNRFKILANPINRAIDPSSTTNLLVADRNITRFTSNTFITDYLINIEYFIINNFIINNNIVFSSSDTDKLRSPINGVAEGVNPGKVILKATSPEGDFAIIDLLVKNTGGTIADTFLSYATNSAAKHACDAIDNRIIDKDSTTKLIYLTQNHTTATYVRNTNCWAYDLDLTCVSPWNSTGGGTRAGTLISPRHVLFCEHLNFHPSIGATIRFITKDNLVITRTITNLATHPNYIPYYPDITIGLLNEDVPNSITFAKILPADWQRYFPSVGSNLSGATIPALVLDQEEKALVSDWWSTGILNNFIVPVNNQRLIFFENIITGDSGNPAFIIINNELVILNTWTYGGAGSGTNIALHQEDINSMMSQLGGGYQTTQIDLSSFPTF